MKLKEMAMRLSVYLLENTIIKKSERKLEKYYLENRERLINKQKVYEKQFRKKINTRLNESFRKKRVRFKL